MTAVRFTPDGLGEYNVAFRYDAAVVALIKTTVPGYARTWSPQRRVWTIDPSWAPVLAAELRTHGHTVLGLEPPPRRQPHAGDIDWAKILFRRVGHQRAPQAYKLLSKLCHPDHGGDHQLQVELNNAYAELSNGRKTA